MSLHVSSTVVLIIKRLKLHYSASGILSQHVHETATYRCDDTTRGFVMQFWPPDDEHNSARNMYRHEINLL